MVSPAVGCPLLASDSLRTPSGRAAGWPRAIDAAATSPSRRRPRPWWHRNRALRHRRARPPYTVRRCARRSVGGVGGLNPIATADLGEAAVVGQRLVPVVAPGPGGGH